MWQAFIRRLLLFGGMINCFILRWSRGVCYIVPRVSMRSYPNTYSAIHSPVFPEPVEAHLDAVRGSAGSPRAAKQNGIGSYSLVWPYLSLMSFLTDFTSVTPCATSQQLCWCRLENAQNHSTELCPWTFRRWFQPRFCKNGGFDLRSDRGVINKPTRAFGFCCWCAAQHEQHGNCNKKFEAPLNVNVFIIIFSRLIRKPNNYHVAVP